MPGQRSQQSCCIEELQVLPAAHFPLPEVWTLRPERGVVSVPGVHDGRIPVDVEHAARYVAEQVLEVALFPRLGDAAGEQRRS